MISALAMLIVAIGCDSPFDASLATSPTSPTTPASVVSSVSVTVGSASLAVGQRTQASATVKDSVGNVISGAPISWASSVPAVATISTTGALNAIGSGTTVITATSDGKSGTTTVSVTQPSGPPPTGGTRIPLVIQRFDSAGGLALVSNAIPLTPGLLMPGALDKVRVFVSGAEQSIYVEQLEGRHADGSLRSVLIQFKSPVTLATPLQGELVVGQSRATVDLPKPTAGRSMPAAVALPTDPNYLIGTNIVGPTITAAASEAQGIPYRQYEQDFGKWADFHWAAEGEMGCNNYYDRALVYYAFWARTGNVEYWRRATRCAVTYRVGYLEANNYGSSPHWSQLEGLDLHYTLTGDDSSRYAIGRVAKILAFWLPYLDSIPATTSMEDRIRARTLMSVLLSWRLNAEGQRGMYQAQLDTAISRIVHSQSADGSYRFPETCGESLNYMTGQLNDALIKIYIYYKADPRIVTAVQRSADFLWKTQWVPGATSFQYVSGVCPAEGNTNPGLDLNGLIVNTFAFTYAHTGNASYRDEADQVFAGAVTHSSIDGSKQFNQEYTSSFLYLKLRQ